MADVGATKPIAGASAGVDVAVNKNGNQYSLTVSKGEKKVQIPLKDCKSAEEAEQYKTALLAEIDKAAVQQGTKPEGVGEKKDMVA
jgi:hypothetical protein